MDELITYNQSLVVRGVCILAIIISHSGNEFAGCYSQLAVSIFIFMSGYGLIKSRRDKPGYMERFFSHRLVALLVPLGVFLLITRIAMPIIDKDLVHFGYIWFVIILVIGYVLFYLTYAVIKTEHRITIMAIMIAVIIIVYYYLTGIVMSTTTLLVFLAGIIIGENERRMTCILERYSIVLSIFLSVVFVVIVYASDLMDLEDTWYMFIAEWSVIRVAFVAFILVMVITYNGRWYAGLSMVAALAAAVYLTDVESFYSFVPFLLLFVALFAGAEKHIAPAIAVLGALSYEMYLYHAIWAWAIGSGDWTYPIVGMAAFAVVTVFAYYLDQKVLGNDPMERIRQAAATQQRNK